ncbi:unnamed protein product [Adineta steineri]|uniref:Glycoside hydrolase family 71 protein n=2 Tax=Adineta steineri TaxID=433720 RepID=A0A818G0B5_9BILA|nr:unnamed protein product [Adineta steineri]
MQPWQAVIDVQEAQSVGIDAFALNVASTDTWSTNAIQYLFDAAAQYNNFKLFFSFDMIHFTHPSQFLGLIEQWHNHQSYYSHNGHPFVSTFYGARLSFGESSPSNGWQKHYREPLQAKGIWTYFVPAFSDAMGSPTGFTYAFPVIDGVMNWDGAWPYESDGQVDNWYRRGELNYATRIRQVLSLAPDFLEIVTWNDAGESHYFGKIWPDSIAGTNIQTYTDGYDHSGWQKLLPPFIKAYKAGIKDVSSLIPSDGKAVSGVFWYRPLLKSASCINDFMGKPRGWMNAEDNFNLVVLADARASEYTINIYSGYDMLAWYRPVQGLNSWSIPGLRIGSQSIEIVDINGRVIASGKGTMTVIGDMSHGVCNYNYQVVGF